MIATKRKECRNQDKEDSRRETQDASIFYNEAVLGLYKSSRNITDDGFR